MTPAVATVPRDLVTTREYLLDRPVVPVLIRVPALRTIARRRAQRRRRLRREVRLGGMMVLVGLPLFALGGLIPGTLSTVSEQFDSIAVEEATPPPAWGATGTSPPQVCLLPELEPVPSQELAAVPRPVAADEHWVAAWEPEIPSRPEPMPPAATTERRAVQTQTPGYLLPVLPELGAGGWAEESPHAGS